MRDGDGGTGTEGRRAGREGYAKDGQAGKAEGIATACLAKRTFVVD